LKACNRLKTCLTLNYLLKMKRKHEHDGLMPSGEHINSIIVIANKKLILKTFVCDYIIYL